MQITKDMTIGEIIEKHPFAAEVMLSYGLHCIGCHVSPHETLENGALGHGMSEEEVSSMLDELNEIAEKNNQKENQIKSRIAFTRYAASKALEIMKTQGKPGLRIRCTDKRYTMDLASVPEDDDIVVEDKGVRMFVDQTSMKNLEGTTIDYVEGLNGSGFKFIPMRTLE